MTDEEMKEQEASEAAKAAEEKQQEYDKAQQQIDQERANARKAKEKADELDRKNAELEDQVKSTREQLEEMNERLNRKTIDPDVADIPEIANFSKGLQEQLAQQNAELKRMKEETERLKVAEASKAKEAEVASLQERILCDCDEEFGPKFRNEALKLADEKCDKGEEVAPTTPLDGYKLMRKCYQEITKKHETKKPSTPSDSGGQTVPVESGIKPGSRQDVLKQMMKNPKSWRAKTG